MLIYDKNLNSYYEVIPVKKIEEVIDKLEEEHKMYYESKDYDIATRIHYAKSVLQHIIKENCEDK